MLAPSGFWLAPVNANRVRPSVRFLPTVRAVRRPPKFIQRRGSAVLVEARNRESASRVSSMRAGSSRLFALPLFDVFQTDAPAFADLEAGKLLCSE